MYLLLDVDENHIVDFLQFAESQSFAAAKDEVVQKLRELSSQSWVLQTLKYDLGAKLIFLCVDDEVREPGGDTGD